MKKLLVLLIAAAFLFSCSNDKTEAKTDTPATETTSTEPKDQEIGDMKYVEIAKKCMPALENNDIDSWMATFADDAVYRFNNLDSVAGKANITDYWKKRRTDAIDSIKFSNVIWLPTKVNKVQAPMQRPGNYALCWYATDIKYKTGKSIRQRMHMVFHFNADDKVDMVSHYLDRAPIIAASTK